MNVIVRAGTAIVGGTIVSLASDTTVAISTPDPTYPRFDLITLKSTGAVGYYTGTPEAAVAVDAAKPETYVKPKPPTTPAGELALAEVFVPAGATAIDKILDRRIATGLAAPQITSGRFPTARMPDGPSGKVLIAQGAGVDPAYADPNFNLIQVSGTSLTARDWSGDFAKLDVALSTRASETTLSALNGKVQNQSAGLFVKDVSVGTSASQVDADTAYRDEVILLADSANTDTVYVGTSASQPFPLAAGASVAIKKTALNLIYLRAASGAQTVHVISGGA
jgi:hypothetical protein